MLLTEIYANVVNNNSFFQKPFLRTTFISLLHSRKLFTAMKLRKFSTPSYNCDLNVLVIYMYADQDSPLNNNVNFNSAN